ncbi:hypothetical protein EOD42_17555 [Rhodovarius crocodyli]|uniref:DUF2232 domain-containing protein n=1 Tax=Rhodovarius crocodyli TaxID=1979269 RepID=A0A437MCN5_9PROT|nr:hypothetical protein [Rhodovarius crocodyli]RVT95388.1 hypothetical protein EOD42_17555 [Rhodovarius crocodyli]
MTKGFDNPAALAGSAAGLVAALLLMWATRGLPLGSVAMWFAPLPILAAGLGFGILPAWLAVAVGAAVVAVSVNTAAMAIFLGIFAVPAALLVSLALRPGGQDLSLPLALLGLYPAALLLALAGWFASSGGIEPLMRAVVEQGSRRMGQDLPETVIQAVTRVMAAAVGFWMALTLSVNAGIAQRFLAKRGLAILPAPSPAQARMPGWYLVLVLAAAAATVVLGGAVALSLLILLLLPFFMMGVAAVHRKLAGRGVWLAAFYVAMVLFLQFLAPLMVGLGLYEQWARRASPPPQT